MKVPRFGSDQTVILSQLHECSAVHVRELRALSVHCVRWLDEEPGVPVGCRGDIDDPPGIESGLLAEPPARGWVKVTDAFAGSRPKPTVGIETEHSNLIGSESIRRAEGNE